MPSLNASGYPSSPVLISSWSSMGNTFAQHRTLPHHLCRKRRLLSDVGQGPSKRRCAARSNLSCPRVVSEPALKATPRASDSPWNWTNTFESSTFDDLPVDQHRIPYEQSVSTVLSSGVTTALPTYTHRPETLLAGKQSSVVNRIRFTKACVQNKNLQEEALVA